MESRVERRLAAILCADVVGYSRLIERDEAGTLRALRSLRHEVVDSLLASHGGRTVQVAGDGSLVEFGSVVDAVQCAIAIQAAVAAYQTATPPDLRLVFRIGINLGDVVADGTDILGDGVNVAARLEQLCEPGGVLVSETVREHVGNRLDLAFEDLGLRELKNIDRPVRVHRVVKLANSSAADVSIADAAKPSVAVLPFVNMSGEPEQEYFSDGITEDLITDLSKISGLFVSARNSTFVYKDKAIDVQEASRKLQVRCILEGSVRKVGCRVRITAQLIDGRSGGHLWGDRFDRELTDIFAVQDEITANIVAALKVRLLPVERKALADQPTANIDAYQRYLRGRQFFHRLDQRSFAIARRLFEQARDLDSNFARAYAGIAACDGFLYLYGANREDVVSPDAIMGNASRALELEPDLPAARASLGLALQSLDRLTEAEREYQNAVRLDQNLFEGWYFYGRLMIVTERLEEAARCFNCAERSHPDDFRSSCLLVMVYRRLGRPELSRTAAEECLARAERELCRNPGNALATCLGAQALVALDQSGRAREWLSLALAIEPDDYWTLYNVACAHSLLGDRDLAVALLERAMPEPSPTAMSWWKYDSDLDPLHEHPRFQALLARLAIEP